jgi:hypothetical protein
MPQHRDKLEERSLTGYRRNVPFSPLLHKPELLLFWKLLDQLLYMHDNPSHKATGRT